METLESTDDPRLEPYAPLRERAQRADSRWFWAEGETAVMRLLASDLELVSVLATPTRAKRLAPLVPPSSPLLVAPRELLGEILGYDLHRGVVAAGVRPPLSTLPDLTAVRRVVVAQGLADPANVGALIRNCRAFGVDLLVLDPKGADPLTPRAIRASMGNVFRQPLAVLDPVDAVRQLREAGCEILAATVGAAALDVRELAVPARWALLVGNEGTGLSAELLAGADRQVTVPIDPDADSLNVAAATAVLLHALR